jgi:hypothetical protein
MQQLASHAAIVVTINPARSCGKNQLITKSPGINGAFYTDDLTIAVSGQFSFHRHTPLRKGNHSRFLLLHLVSYRQTEPLHDFPAKTRQRLSHCLYR